MQWNAIQVDGDVAAAVHGATFGGWLTDTVIGEHDSYRLVEIRNLTAEVGDYRGDRPYVAWSALYDRRALCLAEARDAIQTAGMPDGFNWTNENVFRALFDFGYALRAELPEEGWPTLRAAMETLGIPREVLWDPRQYDLDLNGKPQ